MTTIAVIAHSGKHLGGGLTELREVLARSGVTDPLWYEVRKSKYAPKRARQAVDAGADLVFVWGGDGTVQRCIDALADRGATIAILPAGTANLLATNLDIPQDLEAAVAIGLHGIRRKIDAGTVNGEHFAVIAGVGFDALMIRGASHELKERAGRLAYIWSGAKYLRAQRVNTKIKVDGKRWFDGKAGCVLVGNVGKVFGGITAFDGATPDDGRLEIGVVTANGAWQWSRALARTAFGKAEKSPFVRTTQGRDFDIRLAQKTPYELDGGDRKPTKRLEVSVQPATIAVCVPDTDAARRGGRRGCGRKAMSTASPVPETWKLTGDDAVTTLRACGRRKLLQDAGRRLRFADGFSHARSLAYASSLVMLQGIIAIVGLASALGQGGTSAAIVRTIQAAVPGPAGSLLTSAVTQAHRAGASQRYLGLIFGLVGALITGATFMGQIERGLNRLYGVEQDRPTLRKYGLALGLAVTTGFLATAAFALLAFGHPIGESITNPTVQRIWSGIRWPAALTLITVAITALLRISPRRRQPGLSWLAFGATVSVALWALATVALGAFFRLSTSFGDTYGPLAGIVALLVWALLSSIALLYGGAVGAQLEAVPRGSGAPQDAEKVAHSEPDAPADHERYELTATGRR